MRFILCTNCNKKLLKIGNFDKLSIKCARCKTINAYSEPYPQNLSVQNTEPRTPKSIKLSE